MYSSRYAATRGNSEKKTVIYFDPEKEEEGVSGVLGKSRILPP